MNKSDKTNPSPLFPPELRTASVVPRWSIVWTLNKDPLTNHSYYVTFYAHQIARMLGWDGPVDALMFRAITHDLDETITGDIVSPVKEEILDNDRTASYIDAKMQERLPTVIDGWKFYASSCSDAESDEMEAIIKVADRLDALLFLMVEQRLGNAVISPLLPSALSRLEASFRDLPGDPAEIDRLWSTVMIPAINAHKHTGGFGV